jgi:uncharacterized protein
MAIAHAAPVVPTLESRPASAPPRLGYRLFDMEVHQGPRSGKAFLPYLPERYHQRYERIGTGRSYIGIDQRGGGNRRDTVLEDGSSGATSPAAIAAQLLDRYDIEYVVGTGGMFSVATIPEADYAAALVRAANDWLVNDWLPQDPRYLGALTITAQDPEQAAAEIDRLGDHPRIVEVIMSSASPAPLGQRRYHPIYAAAERHGLPIATHTTNEGRGMNGPPTSAGYPSRYFEYHTNLWQSCAAHMVSLVCEGVFAKYPDLTFVFLEGGVSWVLPLMWQLDREWRLLGKEVAHLTEPPSATIRRHFRFGTQPMEEPDREDTLLAVWEQLDAEHTLCYASDYPHWDFDDPYQAFPVRMSKHLQRRILRENARDLFATKLAALEGQQEVLA